MSRLGKGELLYDDMLTVDDLLARVDAVTVEDVRAVAAELLSRPMSLAVVGPFDGRDFSDVTTDGRPLGQLATCRPHPGADGLG